MGGRRMDEDTVWVELADVVHYTEDSLLVQPADSPDDEIWISRDAIIDHSPGDVEVEDAEEIELTESYAYMKGLA